MKLLQGVVATKMELKLRSGDSDYNWHRENIVFNTICPTPTNIVNCIVLTTKQYLFQQKCLNEKPTLSKLEQEIKFTFDIECDAIETKKDETKLYER